MTKTQEDYVDMTLTVNEVVNLFSNVWKGDIPFTAMMKELNANNDAIVDNQAKQEMKSDPATATKKKARSQLELEDTKLSSALCYMGAETGNTSLQKQTNYAPLAFGRMSEMKLIGVSKIIGDLGNANMGNGELYNVTPELVAEQAKAQTEFSRQLNAPRVAITASSDATDMIATLIDAQHTLIDERFDKAMVRYMGTDFYNRVQKARIIVDSPTHHLALTALFTGGNGEPLPDVKVSIINGDDKVLRNSSPLGNIRVQNLLAGDHVLVAEKPGYGKTELPFLVSEPDTTKLEVMMKPV